MKQSAVEWLASRIINIGLDYPIIKSVELFKQAKEMQNQQQDEFTIGFVKWFTNEKSEYSIMYGNQEKRFATFEEDYTIQELLEIYKKVL